MTLWFIMAGVDETLDIADMLGGENVTMEGSQDEKLESDFSSVNRYSVFQPRVGNPQTDEEWRTYLRKRKRHDTGSVDIETFSKMNTDDKMLALFSKLSIVEDKQNRMVMSPVHEKVDVLENCVNIQSRKLKMLAYRSLDLEARSRRNNLVFRGLADCVSEKCKDVIVDFIANEMRLDISPDQMARAHRMGSLARSRQRYAVTRRPIIAAFKDYSLTEVIMQSAKTLKGTIFRVERDFPTEIVEARRRLWPRFKAERDKFSSSRVVMA